jgi:choline dehydrogenase-like flavoprotein
MNLMEHPMVRLVYRINVPTYNLSGGPLHKIRLLAKYLFNGQGPLASPFEAMAFLRSSESEREPDIQLHFAPVGVEEGSQAKPLGMLPFPSVFVSVKKNYPVSRGRVALASKDPKVPPLIEPRLLESDYDVETMVRGVTAVRRIMSAAPMVQFVTQEVRPGENRTDVDSIANYIRGNVTIPYHPVGTCRMGNDADSVVTPQLQVRGIENLWIADASIMPEHISGNTNAACMMIGAKLGRQLIASGE